MGDGKKHPYQVGAEVLWLTEEEIQARIDKEWDGQRPARVDPAHLIATERAKNAAQFVVKDSGERREFGTGMVRDTNEGKVRYDLAFDGPIFERFARQLTLGAQKYNPRNWMQARTREEYDRFRESAMRHTIMWYMGFRDEDHAAAAVFNFNGAEYVRDRMISEGTWNVTWDGEVKHD